MCLEIGLRGGTKCNNPPDRDFILIKDATGTVPLGISHPPPPIKHELHNFLKFNGSISISVYVSPIFK